MKLQMMILSCFTICVTPLLFSQTNQKPAKEWPSYGNDAGGRRYSASTQINDKNVHTILYFSPFIDRITTSPKYIIFETIICKI